MQDIQKQTTAAADIDDSITQQEKPINCGHKAADVLENFLAGKL